jgi:hypothetical protein
MECVSQLYVCMSYLPEARPQCRELLLADILLHSVCVCYKTLSVGSDLEMLDMVSAYSVCHTELWRLRNHLPCTHLSRTGAQHALESGADLRWLWHTHLHLLSTDETEIPRALDDEKC